MSRIGPALESLGRDPDGVHRTEGEPERAADRLVAAGGQPLTGGRCDLDSDLAIGQPSRRLGSTFTYCSTGDSLRVDPDLTEEEAARHARALGAWLRCRHRNAGRDHAYSRVTYWTFPAQLSREIQWRIFKMSLSEQIVSDLTAAMKAQDAQRTSTLRMVKAAMMNCQIEKGSELDDDDMQKLLRSLVKQRRDSIEQYEKAGRQELVNKEKAEIEVIETYLPQAASQEEIDRAVADDLVGDREVAAAGILRLWRLHASPRI